MSELHHLSDFDLNRYHFDAIRGAELAMVEEHLLWCLDCASRAEKSCVSFDWKGAAKMDHISTEDLELYHLGRVSDAHTVTNIEQHISVESALTGWL